MNGFYANEISTGITLPTMKIKGYHLYELKNTRITDNALYIKAIFFIKSKKNILYHII